MRTVGYVLVVREAHPTSASSLFWWASRALKRVLHKNLTHQIEADMLLPIKIKSKENLRVAVKKLARGLRKNGFNARD